MARPVEPETVKFIVAMLSSDEVSAERVRERLSARWGPVDLESESMSFLETSYYEEEMGRGLRRVFLSLAPLGAPDRLVELKLGAAVLEEESAVAGRRRVNLDPGYLDPCKLVLSSFKWNSQKIFVGRGVYADPMLSYAKGSFDPFPWTFPEYQREEVKRFFGKVRDLFRRQRRDGTAQES
jgi:hypothetical protein